MLRSIGEQSEESMQSVRKKKGKAMVRRIYLFMMKIVQKYTMQKRKVLSVE